MSEVAVAASPAAAGAAPATPPSAASPPASPAGGAAAPGTPASPAGVATGAPASPVVAEVQVHDIGRFWPKRAFNPGFTPPVYLTDPDVFKTIAPPGQVKTFEQRLAEFTDKQLELFRELQKLRTERQWLRSEADDWMLLRYCVARQFDAKKTRKMLEDSIAFNRRMSVREAVCKACQIDAGTHMMAFCGWDLLHRPVVYISYKWADPKGRNDVDNTVAHNLEAFEILRKLMPLGVEQWVAVNDFVSYSIIGDGMSKVGKDVIAMMQDHFPERLGAQVLVDPPTAFWVLWKTVGSLLDERTKKKVHFVYTEKKPAMDEVFPTLFPPHVTEYLAKAFRHNKLAHEQEIAQKKK